MADEKLSPERAARLLRAKAGELELLAKSNLSYAHRNSPVTEEHVGHLTADIALVASLLADHIEDLIDNGDLSPDINDANVRDMRDGRS